MKYLVVVDMQNDFIDGALGTPEARAIVPRVAAKIKAHRGAVLCTQDTHGIDYMQTLEGQNLPVPHCVKPGNGWQLNAAVAKALESAQCPDDVAVFEKSAFGSVHLAQRLLAAPQNALEEVELVGLCTDICVVSNAVLLKSFLQGVPIAVDASCCAGTSPAAHDSALETMRSCQIIIR
ncbi:MAG: cysteine hydrolase [Clostridiales bacterium]|nr:cysteine hydrolase [Clostridiales bacterium]